MGKIEKRHLLSRNCRHFDKTFIEMFLEKSFVSHIFGLLLVCIGCHENHNEKKKKKKEKIYLKNYLLGDHMVYVAETF